MTNIGKHMNNERNIVFPPRLEGKRFRLMFLLVGLSLASMVILLGVGGICFVYEAISTGSVQRQWMAVPIAIGAFFLLYKKQLKDYAMFSVKHQSEGFIGTPEDTYIEDDGSIAMVFGGLFGVMVFMGSNVEHGLLGLCTTLSLYYGGVFVFRVAIKLGVIKKLWREDEK